MEGLRQSESITFTSGTTFNANTFLISNNDEDLSPKALCTIVSELVSSNSSDLPAIIRQLERHLFSQDTEAVRPFGLSEGALLEIRAGIKGRLDALYYLESKRQRSYFAVAIAYGRYRLVQKNKPKTTERSLVVLARSLDFVLEWLFESLKAYTQRGIEESTLSDICTIPIDIMQESFQSILDTIEADTNSKSAATEAKVYLDILMRKVLDKLAE